MVSLLLPKISVDKKGLEYFNIRMAQGSFSLGRFILRCRVAKSSRWDRHLGVTAGVTQVPL